MRIIAILQNTRSVLSFTADPQRKKNPLKEYSNKERDNSQTSHWKQANLKPAVKWQLQHSYNTCLSVSQRSRINHFQILAYKESHEYNPACLPWTVRLL